MKSIFAYSETRRDRKRAASGLYDAVVARAREPVFYRDHNVPDTVDGRFELILLHAFLVWRRLKGEGRAGVALSQALFDAMFRDMDRVLRNMGVGDLSVPHHVRRMMKAFKGRAVAYDVALDAGQDGLLEAALRRNLFGTAAPPEACSLAFFDAYTRRCAATLSKQMMDDLARGLISFGDIDHEQKEENDCKSAPGARMVA